MVIGLSALLGCAQTRLPPVDAPGSIGAGNVVPIGQWSGRFAIKVDRNPVADSLPGLQESAQGGFSLQSQPREMNLELSTPLGQTIALIRVSPGQATLTLADGKTHQAASAQELLESQLGWRIPIERLPRALAALQAQEIPPSDRNRAIAAALGPDWTAQLAELGEGRNRLQLNWDGVSRVVSKLALTMIIDAQVGLSTNLRR